MLVKPSDYEELLAEYSDRLGAIALLRRHRPYLEMIPSLRRPEQSVISIPLPVVRLRYQIAESNNYRITTNHTQAVCLPCDVAFLMCDPEWKIKMGVEIFVYIHRPQEDFSELLTRWRQTQVLVENEYEWLMPLRYEHILSDGAERIYPLFVVFKETSARIIKGLQGAGLPFVVHTPDLSVTQALAENYSPESPIK
ncbi:hypothetical protein [Merismopedia glauca]|uniref:Uncharacterized protein n=1 Tax=Merismopedia glauca CCAP 1448/3 TaxID=1296344 RepID=A0A2T1C033_9CYAN|nr:hypothetical protein [Merismopedia glauca]PSB01564.1 hypothetical protein C7B64_17675 [Merismopedia glauca CCAP 1448/3]